MATHGFQCRTQLILPPQDRAPEVKTVVRHMDGRMYGGVGFAAFFGLGILIFQHAGVAMLLGFIGSLLGRYLASRK